MKRIPPIHPVVFSLYPPVFLYAVNIHRFRFPLLLLPVCIILTMLFLFWCIFRRIFRDNEKAALFLSIQVLLFFMYGYACNLLHALHIRIGPIHIGYNKLLFGIWIPFFFFGLLYLKSVKKNLSGFSTMFNGVASILMVFPLIKILLFGFTHTNIAIRNDNTEVDRLVSHYKKQNRGKTPPDIYYIIPDNYVRSDMLAQYYDFDNSEFLNFLKEKGFYIADKSHSNYIGTDQSLASSLNCEYLDTIIARIPRHSTNRRPLVALHAHAKMIQFLKRIGYTYIFITNGFESIEPRYASHFATPGWSFGGHFLNEYQNGLIDMTPVHYIMRLFHTDPTNYYAQFRKRISFAYDYLENAYKQKGPKLVMAHIMTPHDPIVFGANGEELDDVLPLTELRKKNHDEFIQRYLGEVQYANSKLMKAIDNILAFSDREPVILIHADHGNSAIEPAGDIPSSEYLSQRFAILNAIYLPDSASKELYPEITLVNEWRIVLNHCFHANLPLLKDEIYYSKWETPYTVYNVTDSFFVEPSDQ